MLFHRVFAQVGPHMNNSVSLPSDFSNYAAGLALIGLAVLSVRAWRADRLDRSGLLLALFGAAAGLAEWIGVWTLRHADLRVLVVGQSVLQIAAYAALVELGRKELPQQRRNAAAWGIYLGAATVTAIAVVLVGQQWLGHAATLTLGLPGAALTARALWRRSRSMAARESLGLGALAVAVVLYPPTWSLGLAPAGALCALLAFAGFWLSRQGSESLVARPGLWQRWASPATVGLLLALGGAGIAALDHSEQSLAGSAAADGQSEGEGNDALDANSSRDGSGPPDWKSVSTRRQQTIWPLLLGCGVLAGAWFAACRFHLVP
jgi:hypothetical protein